MANPNVREVLEALCSFAGRDGDRVWTAYVHRELLSRGFTGVRVDLVKQRLTSAAQQGFVRRSTLPNGYYGYSWSITPAGRRYLIAAKEGV